MSKILAVFTPAVRQYLYVLTTSVLMLLVGLRVLDPADVPLWLGTAGALLGLTSSSVAAVAVTRQRKDGTLS